LFDCGQYPALEHSRQSWVSDHQNLPAPLAWSLSALMGMMQWLVSLGIVGLQAADDYAVYCQWRKQAIRRTRADVAAYLENNRKEQQMCVSYTPQMLMEIANPRELLHLREYYAEVVADIKADPYWGELQRQRLIAENQKRVEAADERLLAMFLPEGPPQPLYVPAEFERTPQRELELV
jgi:hypothetical protein